MHVSRCIRGRGCKKQDSNFQMLSRSARTKSEKHSVAPLTDISNTTKKRTSTRIVKKKTSPIAGKPATSTPVHGSEHEEFWRSQAQQKEEEIAEQEKQISTLQQEVASLKLMVQEQSKWKPQEPLNGAPTNPSLAGIDALCNRVLSKQEKKRSVMEQMQGMLTARMVQ